MLTVKQQLRIEQLSARATMANKKALFPVLGLVQRNSQYVMRKRKTASPPGTPPSRHVPTQAGLGRIRYWVGGNRGIIGPVKFSWSNFFNEPVTRMQEIGGIFRSQFTAYMYPERSYMYKPTKDLAQRGLISRRYAINLGRFL